MTRAALDSNILVYLARISRVPEDDDKIDRIQSLIGALQHVATLVAPTQALGELFVVMRRSGVAAAEARSLLLQFEDAFADAPSEARTALSATDLVVDHKLQFWDALIISAAAEAGCTLLLSEDMQDGFVTRGLTIVNPLADVLHPKLAALLGQEPER